MRPEAQRILIDENNEEVPGDLVCISLKTSLGGLKIPDILRIRNVRWYRIPDSDEVLASAAAVAPFAGRHPYDAGLDLEAVEELLVVDSAEKSVSGATGFSFQKSTVGAK